MEYETEKTDIEMAVEQLEDEVNGITAYKILYDTATCPQLKKIAQQHMLSEKQHALQLIAWINAYIESEVK